MTSQPEPQPAPAGDTLTALFAATAARVPDQVAVSDDQRSLTYAELDRASDAAARLLSAHGVTGEDRVGVYLNRSVDLCVAILGVLKAGAAYVAVDSRYPDTRRDLMLGASGAKVVITEPAWVSRLDELPANIVTLGEESTGAVGADVTPGTAASVLFTSGSSGEPKPIVLEHRNIVSFAVNPALPALTGEDRVGQISSVSFDAFHFELWSTLGYGASLVILPPVPDLLAADFQRQLRRHRITAMLTPTMVVNQVVREDSDAFAPLRLLHVGGDVLQPAACREVLSGQFAGELYNLYGPAEITTACTFHRVTADDAAGDTIPIGVPLAGVSVYLLGPDGAEVPDGEIGEIHVAGPGVARGYQDRPELTAERFPAIVRDGRPQRVYRTGDLARRREDGVLLFVGRADNQVKVRGYRVEPGEVERALRAHHDVLDAVVLPDGDGEDRRLVAVVVLDAGLSVRELRDRVAAELPDFMVPSGFLSVREMPVNAHGKRDVEALRELLGEQRRRREEHVPPATDTERYLARLWAELLDVEDIGANEDFFALGGHSLQAFRAYRRIGRDLGVTLQFPTLLDNTVLRDLAAVIDRGGEPV